MKGQTYEVTGQSYSIKSKMLGKKDKIYEIKSRSTSFCLCVLFFFLNVDVQRVRPISYTWQI